MPPSLQLLSIDFTEAPAFSAGGVRQRAEKMMHYAPIMTDRATLSVPVSPPHGYCIVSWNLPLKPYLIRPQIESELPFPAPNRSPYRAPFKNKPKLTVFWQTDEIKSSRIGLFQPVSGPKRVFGRSRKKVPKKGRYRPIMGSIWGSIWAYFGKQGS